MQYTKQYKNTEYTKWKTHTKQGKEHKSSNYKITKRMRQRTAQNQHTAT